MGTSPWWSVICLKKVATLNCYPHHIMSQFVTKPTKWPVHPAKKKKILDIHPVFRSESSLCALWVVKNRIMLVYMDGVLYVNSWDSNHTGGIPRLLAHRSVCSFCRAPTCVFLPFCPSDSKKIFLWFLKLKACRWKIEKKCFWLYTLIIAVSWNQIIQKH